MKRFISILFAASLLFFVAGISSTVLQFIGLGLATVTAFAFWFSYFGIRGGMAAVLLFCLSPFIESYMRAADIPVFSQTLFPLIRIENWEFILAPAPLTALFSLIPIATGAYAVYTVLSKKKSNTLGKKLLTSLVPASLFALIFINTSAEVWAWPMAATWLFISWGIFFLIRLVGKEKTPQSAIYRGAALSFFIAFPLHTAAITHNAFEFLYIGLIGLALLIRLTQSQRTSSIQGR